MTPEESKALADKMAGIGYPGFDVLPGEEDVLMLHVQDHLIGGALYALSLSDEQLKALVEETMQVVEVQ